MKDMQEHEVHSEEIALYPSTSAQQSSSKSITEPYICMSSTIAGLCQSDPQANVKCSTHDTWSHPFPSSPQVTQKRGRLCVSVKAGRQGELPRGSVKMGSSRTGATMYMEPANLIDLNNAVIQLQSQEEAAELAVLQRLSQSLAREASKVDQVQELAGRDIHQRKAIVLA